MPSPAAAVRRSGAGGAYGEVDAGCREAAAPPGRSAGWRARWPKRSGSATSSVEPQVFDVLAYLALQRDRVVTKNELLSTQWLEPPRTRGRFNVFVKADQTTTSEEIRGVGPPLARHRLKRIGDRSSIPSAIPSTARTGPELPESTGQESPRTHVPDGSHRLHTAEVEGSSPPSPTAKTLAGRLSHELAVTRGPAAGGGCVVAFVDEGPDRGLSRWPWPGVARA